MRNHICSSPAKRCFLMTLAAVVMIQQSCNNEMPSGEKRSFIEVLQFWKKRAAQLDQHYEPPHPRQVHLAIDNSGSMLSTDKKRMALFSAMIFCDLLDERDNLTISTFPLDPSLSRKTNNGRSAIGSAYMKSWKESQKDLFTGSRAEAKKWIRSIEYGSPVTIFTEPIERGIQQVNADPEASKKAIVFFSDGSADRFDRFSLATAAGDSLQNAEHDEEVRHLKNAVIPVLADNAISFYGLILGENLRKDHFEMLSENTGGITEATADPAQLPAKFAKVFSEILQTRVDACRFNNNGHIQDTISKYIRDWMFLFTEPAGDIKLTIIKEGAHAARIEAVSYTHLTLPTIYSV